MSRALNIGSVSSDGVRYEVKTMPRLRLVLDRSGSDSHPVMYVFRNGVNGSPLGIGQVKPARTIELPRVSFGWGYRHRSIGGLKLYVITEKFWRAITQ